MTARPVRRGAFGAGERVQSSAGVAYVGEVLERCLVYVVVARAVEPSAVARV